MCTVVVYRQSVGMPFGIHCISQSVLPQDQSIARAKENQNT